MILPRFIGRDFGASCASAAAYGVRSLCVVVDIAVGSLAIGVGAGGEDLGVDPADQGGEVGDAGYENLVRLNGLLLVEWGKKGVVT